MTDVAPAPASPEGYDPITLSVILSRFYGIATEMTLTLERTAWTSILALARDFSCAIYDAVPRQISMLDAIPVHTTSLQLVLAEIADAFEGDVHEGDVFVCNDPWRMNTHVADLVTACPVFHEGRHLFWSVTKGHQMDTGAFVPSSITAAARDVWQEGIRIPPIKFAERGQLREDVIDLYLSNVRYRDALYGDLLAQLGSIEKGRQRLVALAQEYGNDTLLRYVDEIVAYADRRMSEEINAIPDGEYEAQGWIDSDGVDVLDVPIHAKVTVAGDKVTVDYRESGPQARGGVNGTVATSKAAGAIPFLYYIDPDIPHNHGCISHIDVITRPGTICQAEYPASTSTATVVPSDMMADTVNKAMAQVIPERVPAGGARCSNLPQLSGVDDRDGSAWGFMLFNGSGGSGGSHGADGWPLYANHASMGAVKALPVEQLELLYPILIGRMEVEPESMGFGRWNGGPGVRLEVRARYGATPIECVTYGDGCSNPPHGVLGGTPGIGGGQYVEPRDGGPRRIVQASGVLQIHPDEVWIGVSTGGGGYGHPAERAIEAVVADVRDELVSPATARAVYGVALDDALNVDEAATAELRAALLADDRPLVNPTAPAAARWLDAVQRPGDELLVNPI